MKPYVREILMVVCSFAFGSTALACNIDSYEPEDVKNADTVVVGRISNYRLIPNLGFADKIRPKVDAGTASAWERQKYEEILRGAVPGGFYGKFDVAVEEVLKGRVNKKFSATYHAWTPCCFGPNEKEVLPKNIRSQRYLIAFQQPKSNFYLGSISDSSLPTVHINECIGPFLMNNPDGWTKSIRKYLARSKAKERRLPPAR